MKWLLRLTDRIADAVVVNCESMRQYLVADEGVRETKVHLCYNALDTERYRRRQAESLYSDRLVIGTVGALRREKRVDTLLQAFAGLSELGAKLVIVGSGPEEAKLQALARTLGIEADCHFVPAVSDVTEWLSRIDIFVLPSRSEGLSNSLMEAMACGCCPIASRVGGNPELIKHGENGLLFEVDNVRELASQMRILLTDESRRRAFADRAAAKMGEFTYAKTVSTMQTIYESVLSPVDRNRLLSAPHNG